ncbi:MAG TPA: Pycsar system effector family protein [Chitinophagales bacterium]|nr:Pycsar system effector family protein [Chitinophagales bacterium]
MAIVIYAGVNSALRITGKSDIKGHGILSIPFRARKEEQVTSTIYFLLVLIAILTKELGQVELQENITGTHAHPTARKGKQRYVKVGLQLVRPSVAQLELHSVVPLEVSLVQHSVLQSVIHLHQKNKRPAMEDRYAHLQFIIGRFDHYFDSLNNKASFYLGLNTFITGGLVGVYFALSQNIHFTRYEDIVFLIAITLGFASMFLLVWGVKPFLKDIQREGQSTVPIFFGSIAKLSAEKFLTDFMQHERENMIKDMALQAHILACGLERKFIRVQYASYVLIAEFVLLIQIVIIILNKH